jgi:octaprenyl-diphosphate synthase
MDSEISLIPQLATYLIASGGKRIRPLLTLASTRLFDATTIRPYRLAAAVEFIHTATLLHDDVVDESEQRRGKASANIVFGNQASVLVGDFLFSRAFELMVEDGSLDVLRVLSHASAVITEGEVLQLSLQHNLDTNMEQYNAVIGAKTASLFAAATEVGAIISGQNHRVQKQLRDYGYHLGMAFQIADDILDYQGSTDTLGKNIGDDFKEGKMSAPVIFALQEFSSSQKEEWKTIFGQTDIDDTILQNAIRNIQHSGALEKCKDMAKDHILKAQTSLQPFATMPLANTLIDLADYSLSRNN